MSLDAKMKRWSGVVYRQIPDAPDCLPLDFSNCWKSEGRWHMRGEPTLYTGKDDNVCVCEFGRNMDAFGVSRKNALNRVIYEFTVELDAVLDLTDRMVLNDLGIVDIKDFEKKDKCRATAKHLRISTKTQAVFVPSLAFEDNLNNWCLVVFLEKVTLGKGGFIKKDKVYRKFNLSSVTP